jgi:hypothetical protein
MKTEKTSKTVVAKPQSEEKKEQLKLDAKVRALRDSDPKKWTWAKLDEKVYGAKGSHGGRSFVAYKREEKRLKADKRAAAKPVRTAEKHVETAQPKRSHHKKVSATSINSRIANLKTNGSLTPAAIQSAPEDVAVCGGVTETE